MVNVRSSDHHTCTIVYETQIAIKLTSDQRIISLSDDTNAALNPSPHNIVIAEVTEWWSLLESSLGL